MYEISTKPYLIRAIYEWCMDNSYTPYILVKIDDDTRVPVEYVKNGEIVLNIGPQAVDRLVIGNETVECSGRFRGVARELSVPVSTVAMIYARENGKGMQFSVDQVPNRADETSPSTTPAADDEGQPRTPPPTGGGKPSLRRVK